MPAGFTAKGRVDSLNLAMDAAFTYGEIEPLYWCKNRKDRAYIHVGRWDLRGVPDADRLRVVWEDDFPNGLRPGTNPRVTSLEDGSYLGSFDGAQGFIPAGASLHPVLAQMFDA